MDAIPTSKGMWSAQSPCLSKADYSERGGKRNPSGARGARSVRDKTNTVDVGWRQMLREDAIIHKTWGLIYQGCCLQKKDKSGNSETVIKRACASLTAKVENSGKSVHSDTSFHLWKEQEVTPDGKMSDWWVVVLGLRGPAIPKASFKLNIYKPHKILIRIFMFHYDVCIFPEGEETVYN